MTVYVQIDECSREAWTFTQFGLHFVLTGFRIEVKPKGKRKWTTEKGWSKYETRHNSAEEPKEIPLQVREQLKQEILAAVQIKLWNEWKPER